MKKFVCTTTHITSIPWNNSRNFADWASKIRTTPPGLRHDPENSKVLFCKITGYPVMHIRDFNDGNQNHILLSDNDYKHPTNSDLQLCRGVWTSSASIIKHSLNDQKIAAGDYSGVTNMISLEKISPSAIKGPQYFVKFDKPRLINRKYLKTSEDGDNYIAQPDVKETLDELLK